MPNEQVTADAKRVDVAGCFDSPRIVNLIGHQKKKKDDYKCVRSYRGSERALQADLGWSTPT